jgi:hypothetical protein
LKPEILVLSGTQKPVSVQKDKYIFLLVAVEHNKPFIDSLTSRNRSRTEEKKVFLSVFKLDKKFTLKK